MKELLDGLIPEILDPQARTLATSVAEGSAVTFHWRRNGYAFKPPSGSLSTSSRRVISAQSQRVGYRPARGGSDTRPAPGLTDRERLSGRPASARSPGGRYFTLAYTPRRYVPVRV